MRELMRRNSIFLLLQLHAFVEILVRRSAAALPALLHARRIILTNNIRKKNKTRMKGPATAQFSADLIKSRKIYGEYFHSFKDFAGNTNIFSLLTRVKL